MSAAKIQNRIIRLREAMATAGITYYLIPAADCHAGEYVCGHFKAREYFSGFSGSNGTLLVSAKETGLWTDARYFLQAERELLGTGIVLYRMGEKDVLTIPQYLAAHMGAADVLGFDGRVVSAAKVREMEDGIKGHRLSVAYERDWAGELWADRPAVPANPVWMVDLALAGCSAREKLARLRQGMRENNASYLFLSKLDDIMWLFNVRGSDIPCNPVAFAYAFVGLEQAFLFVQERGVSRELYAGAKENGFEVHFYDTVAAFLRAFHWMDPRGKILADPDQTSYTFHRMLSQYGELVECPSPVALLKARKNETEIGHLTKVFERDSAVVTKFIYWLKTRGGDAPLTEQGAAAVLDRLRRETEGCLDLSFPTIAAYGANAAVVHYQANDETDTVLQEKGFFLVDSGGQYIGGTTDVTRTVALGELTFEMRRAYTAVAAGMLALSAAVFPEGTAGRNLDVLARQFLWKEHLNYNHGTGHGIGYMLNVHEAPVNISYWYRKELGETPFAHGMVVSDEPGYYQAGDFGIRTENALLCVRADGQEGFLGFRHLTLVPLERDAIDETLLDSSTRRLLNEYHQTVRERISPYLTKEEREWLGEVCKAL